MQHLVRALEIRYLGNVDPNLYFALLTDPPDSDQPFDEKDELAAMCSGMIEELNEKYAKPGTSRFFHLHRNRTFNATDNTWMGWERKRGKLLDFNELLRGGNDRFPIKVGNMECLRRVRFVITLDSDTQLPRGSAARLIGAIAHPLNQPVIDPITENRYGRIWRTSTSHGHQRAISESLTTRPHFFRTDRSRHLHASRFGYLSGFVRRRKFRRKRYLRGRCFSNGIG